MKTAVLGFLLAFTLVSGTIVTPATSTSTAGVSFLTSTISQLSARLRCAECGGQLHSVKPWRMEDVLGKPLGRRG